MGIYRNQHLQPLFSLRQDRIDDMLHWNPSSPLMRFQLSSPPAPVSTWVYSRPVYPRFSQPQNNPDQIFLIAWTKCCNQRSLILSFMYSLLFLSLDQILLTSAHTHVLSATCIFLDCLTLTPRTVLAYLLSYSEPHLQN